MLRTIGEAPCRLKVTRGGFLEDVSAFELCLVRRLVSKRA
jgi:hypothetical protein